MTGELAYGIPINLENTAILLVLSDMARYHWHKLRQSDNDSVDYQFQQFLFGIALFFLIANLSAFYRSYMVYVAGTTYLVPDYLSFATFIDRFAMLCGYIYFWAMGRKFRTEWF